MLVRDFIRCPKGLHFGIEAEVEGLHGYYNQLQENGAERLGAFWRLTGDGSLRNGGVELVSAQPVPVCDLQKAVQELGVLLEQSYHTKYYDGSEEEVQDEVRTSPRTSTHVHVNVGDLSFPQVLGMLVLGAAWEPLLQECVQEHRRTNLFCISMHNVATLGACLRTAYELYQGNNMSWVPTLSQVGKYSSINPGRLADLGTIEFRALEGWPGEEKLLFWCSVLQRLYEHCASIHDLSDVFQSLYKSEEEVRALLFGDKSPEFSGKTLSFKDTVAASISILSKAKQRPVSRGSYWYRSPSSNHFSGPVERNAFGQRVMPEQGLLDELAHTLHVGASAFDITCNERGSVDFGVCPAGTSSVEYIVRYTPDAPAVVQEVEFDLFVEVK